MVNLLLYVNFLALLTLFLLLGTSSSFVPLLPRQSRGLAENDNLLHTRSSPESLRNNVIVRAESESPNDMESNKFGFGQRIESIKTAVAGAVSGGVALTPASGIHDLLLSRQGLAQWEFDTDTGVSLSHLQRALETTFFLSLPESSLTFLIILYYLCFFYVFFFWLSGTRSSSVCNCLQILHS